MAVSREVTPRQRCNHFWSERLAGFDRECVPSHLSGRNAQGAGGVLDPSQRMPREAMLYAYTRNSACAMNEQGFIGSIAPGKQADLVLVDRDVLTVPAEELRATKVVWTMVGGKMVYQAH